MEMAVPLMDTSKITPASRLQRTLLVPMLLLKCSSPPSSPSSAAWLRLYFPWDGGSSSLTRIAVARQPRSLCFMTCDSFGFVWIPNPEVAISEFSSMLRAAITAAGHVAKFWALGSLNQLRPGGCCVVHLAGLRICADRGGFPAQTAHH